MEEHINNFLQLKEQQYLRARENFNESGNSLKKIDGELINQLETLKERLLEQCKSYKSKKIWFAVGRPVSLIASTAAAFALPFNPLVSLGAGSVTHGMFQYLGIKNDEANEDKNQEFYNRLIELARFHDRKAEEFKNAITNFENSAAFFGRMNVRPEISASTKVSIAISALSTVVNSSFISECSGVAIASETFKLAKIMIFIQLVHGIIELIAAIQEIKSVEDIHPLTKVIDKFVADLQNEISELNSRMEINPLNAPE